HTSGLPSYPPVDELVASVSDSSARLTATYNWINNIDRLFKPGESFTYSGSNFAILQRIIESVSATSLSKYTQRNIFNPLSMNNTTYKPPDKWRSIIAPTSKQLIGTVHDPFARKLMGGISGNAGLFATGEDLAIFAAMLLNNGKWNGKQILSEASVETMTTIPPSLKSYGRGLGWDLYSSYSTNQGVLFGPKTYGHTGFTGTSIILDPDTDTAVILLT